jgi:hypothetical protein
MRQQIMIGVVVFVAAFGPSMAAQEPADMPPLAQERPMPLPVPPPDFKVGMLAIEPFDMGEAVENAPYSAEIVNEVTQQFADGNRIERRNTGTVARDSRGRVRREHQLAAIGPVVPDGDVRMVTITDPVARVSYALDPVRKVAMRSHAPKLLRGPIAGPKGGSLMISGAGVPAGGFEIQLETRDEPGSPEAQTEPLGTKEIEGVRAEGTRTTATIPAGAIGNLRPIEIVSERWYSSELGVVVYSRRSDPRFGETVYRLTNITRSEPDPSLFQVPADYRREDMKPLPFEPPARDN